MTHPEHGFHRGRILAARVRVGVLYEAQRSQTLAATGPQARLRHPQYMAFILIMTGFRLQWPTLPTVLMLPVLVYMYVRLARREEQEVSARFGEVYERYRERTPAFVPRPSRTPKQNKILNRSRRKRN